jgi:hypothetical protein
MEAVGTVQGSEWSQVLNSIRRESLGPLIPEFDLGSLFHFGLMFWFTRNTFPGS